MQDKTLIELCQKIYRKHREAINLIVENGEVSVFQEIAADVIESGDCEILASSSRDLWFLPASWAKIVPENGTGWGHLKRPVSVAAWIRIWPQDLGLIFEACAMPDKERRLALVKRLREKGFHLTQKAFREDARYSRFYSRYVKISDAGDEEVVRSALENLFAQARENFPKVEAVLKEVFVGPKA